MTADWEALKADRKNTTAWTGFCWSHLILTQESVTELEVGPGYLTSRFTSSDPLLPMRFHLLKFPQHPPPTATSPGDQAPKTHEFKVQSGLRSCLVGKVTATQTRRAEFKCTEPLLKPSTGYLLKIPVISPACPQPV